MDHNIIYKHESNRNKKCLSVGNFGIMSVVVCSLSVAYTMLYRGLKYLLKIPYIIQDYPKYCPMSKKISQKWMVFVFGSTPTHLHQSFTESFTTFWSIDMPDITARYGKFLVFIAFFVYVHTLNFYKLYVIFQAWTIFKKGVSRLKPFLWAYLFIFIVI